VADNRDIEWAVLDIKDRASKITLYRSYYDGEHRAPWATPKWNVAFADLFGRFRDNLCPAIINAKADRIQLTSIRGPNDAINAAISSIWDREKLEARQGEITKNAFKDGDAFVLIWPDEANLARWYIQRGDRMAISYSDSPQGDIDLAAKLWPQHEWSKDGRSLWRLTLYYRDRIEKYITEKEINGSDIPEDPARWNEFEETALTEDEAESGEDVTAPGWPAENPYGIVPVFPFPNNADTGLYGVSELKDVIPMQDALNKSVADMLVGSEFVAWPQRILIGVEVDVDESGQPTGKEQKQALDRILAIGNPDAKAAEWAGADLTKFIAEQDSFRAEMARISQTPLHYLLLSGDFPSGEALDAAEAPMIAQVEDRILAQKPVWGAAMSFALTIERVTHDPGSLNAIYKPTRRINWTAMAEEMRVKKELGVPDEQLWQEMGYDEKQVAEFTAAKEERRAEMQANFDAGIGGINPEATNGQVPAGIGIGE
jgi:Phage portal protein, SPP1 Gp6-like